MGYRCRMCSYTQNRDADPPVCFLAFSARRRRIQSDAEGQRLKRRVPPTGIAPLVRTGVSPATRCRPHIASVVQRASRSDAGADLFRVGLHGGIHPSVPHGLHRTEGVARRTHVEPSSLVPLRASSVLPTCGVNHVFSLGAF